MKVVFAIVLALVLVGLVPSARARRSSSGSHHRVASAGIKKTKAPLKGPKQAQTTKYYRSGHPRISKHPGPKHSSFNLQAWVN